MRFTSLGHYTFVIHFPSFTPCLIQGFSHIHLHCTFLDHLLSCLWLLACEGHCQGWYTEKKFLACDTSLLMLINVQAKKLLWPFVEGLTFPSKLESYVSMLTVLWDRKAVKKGDSHYRTWGLAAAFLLSRKLLNFSRWTVGGSSFSINQHASWGFSLWLVSHSFFLIFMSATPESRKGRHAFSCICIPDTSLHSIPSQNFWFPTFTSPAYISFIQHFPHSL